jgi:hypothetical protein
MVVCMFSSGTDCKKKKKKDMNIMQILSDLPLYNLFLIKLGIHQKFQHNSFMLFLLSDKLDYYCLEYHLHVWLHHVILVCVFFFFKVHPASYISTTEGFLPVIKYQSVKLIITSIRGYESWSYISILSYVFMVWCLIKHRGSYTIFNGLSI